MGGHKGHALRSLGKAGAPYKQAYAEAEGIVSDGPEVPF